ncbi:unnamed protein product, partial [Gongylonema pulchrum]|uniref:MYND-type domain-containing protein n=1 Tax=Gongylonema pulchrum TaxID=637853 RepID=A0A183D6M5_9BILA
MSSVEPMLSIFQRLRYFEEPFAYICMNNQVTTYCSYCLRKPANNKLYRCNKCNFARYCNKVFLVYSWLLPKPRLAWKQHHRAECRRLEAVFPNLPLTEVLFLSRIIDRVLFLEQNGDKCGWEKNRKWTDLLSHQEDVRNDPPRYAHFEKIYGKMALFRKDEVIEKDKFFEVFCKSVINSHSIHTSAGDEIGMALDLGVSMYDHSCRPNCSLVFDGFRACLRPLTPETNAADPKTAYISYIDIGRSRYQRRLELKGKWYFLCKCERCTDPADDVLTAMRCTAEECDEPLIVTEEPDATEDMVCRKCGTVTRAERIRKCQHLMLSLPA